MPNFVEIAQTTAEIYQFSIFRRHLGFPKFQILTVKTVRRVELHPRAKFRQDQGGGRRHLGFLKFQIFNGRDTQEGQTALLCQILSKSLKTRLRYGYFSIFQDGGRRHVGFWKFQIFNGQNGQKCRTTPACQISWKSVKPRPRYGDF